MKNPTNPNPNSVIYYNALQLVLPLDLSISIDKNDLMFSFLEATEGVNLSKYVSSIRSNNTHLHDRGMLLKVILFAYSEGKQSLSEIEHLCKTDIRYLYLSNEERPSKMAFQRLISSLTDTIDNIFFDISKHIAYDLMLCDENVQYIDGTKIEANAHKNSFVYKKRIYNAYNWKVNEEGYKVCPADRAFNVHLFDKCTNTSNGNLCISQMYTEPNECKECARKKDCTKGERRTSSRNDVLEELQGTVDKNLSIEQGKEMKRQRSIQVEGAFGVIKQDFKFTRYNLRKYHISRMKNQVSMMC